MRLGALPFWVRIACLFLIRSGGSTWVLSLMVLASVATLIFLSSLAVGVNDAMVRNSVGLYSGHITGTDLPAGLGAEALAAEGVVSVVKRVLTPGVLQRGERVEWVTLVASNPAEEAKSAALFRKLVAGRAPRAGERALLLGKPTAERLGVHPGDEVSFRQGTSSPAMVLTVSGVYRTGIDSLDRGLAFCPSDTIPGGGLWSAAVFLREGVEPRKVVTGYRTALGSGPKFQTWDELMPDLRQLIDLNYVSMTLVTVIVFGLVALGISCAFVIFILKNLREYGIVKAMGVTPLETTFLITAEVVLLNLAATGAGVLLGALAVYAVRSPGIDLTAFTSHNQYFAVSGVVFPRLTPYSLWLPPAVALACSLAASIWPAALVVRSRTAEVLRSG